MFVLAVAAIAVWVPNVHAESGFFSPNCGGCHSGVSSTCNGCHAHGVHSNNSKSDINLRATTDKTSYLPGEQVTVTISGGYRNGWVRAILYNENGVEVRRSTGPNSMGGGSSFPIQLAGTAPASAGTYTFKASWYGNRYDLSQRGGTTVFGPNWTPDPNNPNHGQEIVSTNSFTVSAPVPAGSLSVSSGSLASTGTAGGPFSPSSQSFTLSNPGGQPVNWTAGKTQTWVTLSSSGGTLAAGANTTVTVSINSGANSLAAGSYSDTVTFTNTTNGTGNATRSVSLTVNAAPAAVLTGLTIGSPSSVPENSSASYTANATWSDGSTSNVTVSAVWSVSPATYATINSGVLVTSEVPSDQTVTVSASYASGGVTKVADKVVTITDVPTPPPPAAGTISVMPIDGATDVPVTTVVTGTGSSSVDIRDVFNRNTFRLQVDPSGASGSMLMGDSAPLDVKCVNGSTVNGLISYNDSHTTATFTPYCRLANGATYTATLTPEAGTPQAVLPDAMTWSFTTIAKTVDTDDDGVEDGEDDHPRDKKKATPPSSRGGGKFLVDISGDPTATLANVEGLSDMSLALNQSGRPSGFDFVDGMVMYTVEGVAPGSTITVKVNFPSGIPTGSKVYKADGNGFSEFVGAVVRGNNVTLTLTDGGSGDSDGLANGVIVDPVGVAVPSGSAGVPVDLSTSAAGGGCSVSGGHGGWKDAVGSFAPVFLVWLGLLLLRRREKRGM